MDPPLPEAATELSTSDANPYLLRQVVPCDDTRMCPLCPLCVLMRTAFMESPRQGNPKQQALLTAITNTPLDMYIPDAFCGRIKF